MGTLTTTPAVPTEPTATSTNVIRPAEKHIRSLDGIRGLAILVVMGGHIFGANAVSSKPSLQVLLSLRGLNWAGVNLFFALSGFLITSILYDTLHSPHYFKNFFARRTLRIFPLYYGVLLVLLALTWLLHVPWDSSPLRFLTYTQNLPYTVHPKGPMPWGILRHFWSLAVEEQFYLIWPFVIFWLRTWKKVMIAALTGSALALIFRTALAVTGGFPQNHSTPFCMDALLLGGVLSLLLRSRFRDSALRYGRWVFAAACLCIIPIAVTRSDFYWETSFYLTTLGLSIANLGAVGLIAAALQPGSFPKRVFSAKWLGFFGKYSYGLYVFHVMIGAVVIRFLGPVLIARGTPPSVINLMLGLITLALSILLAVASYQLYETRFLRLKMFFPYPLAAAAPAAPPVATPLDAPARTLAPPPRPAYASVTPSPELHHLKPLDGVRGLAILMVILWHAFESDFLTKSLVIKLAGLLIAAGSYGVDLFFVLSGFLITGILIDTRSDPHYFRRFLARRVLRILPLYYGVLFVLMVLTLPLHLHWNGMLPLLLLYLQNLRPFAIDSLAVAPGIGLYHFWSLAVEEQFYIVWPLIVYWLRDRRTLLWTTLGGVVFAFTLRSALLVHGLAWQVVHVSTVTRADTLLIGALLAMAYRSAAWERVQRLAPFVFLVFVPSLFLPAAWLPLPFGGLHETMTALCFASLLAWSLRPASTVRWLFERPWLRFLGKYSYGIYVLHVFVVTPLNPILRHAIDARIDNKLVGVVASGCICLALSILAAWISFHAYEKRFLKLKRFFDYERVAPARVQTVAPTA